MARHRPLITALILLLIAVSRVGVANRYPMDYDEIWALWQSLGTPAEILRWTPYDWPPLHYQLLGVWQAATGIHPLTARFSSVLIFLIGVAGVWALARQLMPESAWGPILAGGALGAFGYAQYVSVLARGYVLILALLPYALIFASRYLRRPTLGRAVPLALTMAVMFYTHLSAVLAFVLIGLFSLIMAGLPLGTWAFRWALPGGIAAVAALPEILSKVGVGLAGSRLAAVQSIQRPPALTALADLYRQFAGEWWPFWAGLAVLAALTLVVNLLFPLALKGRGAGRVRATTALTLWAGMPVFILIAAAVFGTFSPSHAAWVMPGVALWLGYALARLPRPLPGLTLIGIGAVLALAPVPTTYHIPTLPLKEYLPSLVRAWRPGDVIVRDPNLRADSPEVWDYFARVYFPHGGMAFVDDPGTHRRVWYVQTDGEQAPDLRAAVEKGRIAGVFFGPWDCLIRLYEGPPDPVGIAYENGLRFHGLEVLNATSPGYPVFREGETLQLRLWWAADRAVGLDYSIAVQFTGPDGVPLSQTDTIQPVGEIPRETSRWPVGGFIVEERALTLPDTLKTGAYALKIAVYQWWDGVRIAAAGLDADRLYPAETVYVKAW
jgi:hypothetical protein